tara:strand:- start:671 stop:1291 length:621 start_codon:yes stop_codon:yes gene_type:complete
MPVYLDTRGNSVLSVAVCDRCSRKFAYVDLMPDPNFPGMRVCKDDLDQFDPWRLPAIQTENIALRFPRPDVSVATEANLLDTQGAPNDPFQYDNFFIDGVPPGSGAQGLLTTSSQYQISPPIPSPIPTSVSPANGTTAGGTTVTITGQNFSNILTVRFGGIFASFSIQDSQTIIVTSPAYLPAGTVNITVTGTFGLATFPNSFTYV